MAAMTGKEARELLKKFREQYTSQQAFYEAAKAAGMNNSAFGKLLHEKNVKKEEDLQLEMF